MKKFLALLKFPLDVCLLVISFLPGDLGYFLRYRYWKKRLRLLGEHVRIEAGVYFQNPDFISIGDNSWIDRNAMILAGLDVSQREKIIKKNEDFIGEPGVVHIGKNVHLGAGCIISGIAAGVYISDDCCLAANCKVYAFSHHYRSIKDPSDRNCHFGSQGPHDHQCIVQGPVYLGKNTGVALNSVILPGVSILHDCFVMINSVVYAEKTDGNSVLSGNPAKKIGDRFSSK